MRQAQLSILDTLLKENSEFYALELITILWASDHDTQCDKYHTTCYEDSPSRRMGIWKDFIEVVSVYPDLGLAKGPRERGRTFTTEVCKGPEGSKREAHGIFGWKGVCWRWVERQGGEGNERREAGEQASRGVSRDAGWPLWALDTVPPSELALGVRNWNQFQPARQGGWCYSLPGLLITRPNTARETGSGQWQNDPATLLTVKSEVELHYSPSFMKFSERNHIPSFSRQTKQNSSHRAKLSQITNSGVSFCLS